MLILSYENELNLHVKENSFSYEKMSTKTRFEKEAKGNSEMAYFCMRELNTCSPVSPTRFRFGGRDWDKGGSRYLQNGVRRVESNAKIVKAGFHSFRSILDQNALLKASQTSRNCAQEFSSGKEWVLRCLDTFGGPDDQPLQSCKNYSALYESFMVWRKR